MCFVDCYSREKLQAGESSAFLAAALVAATLGNELVLFSFKFAFSVQITRSSNALDIAR